MTRKEAMTEDLKRMEAVCERTATRCDIWQDRLIYWMAVALVHLLEAQIKKGE